MKRWNVWFLSLLILFLIGCGTKTNVPVEQSTNGDQPSRQPTNSIQAAKPSASATAAEKIAEPSLADWPTGDLAAMLPLPAAGTVLKSEETDIDGGKAGMQKSLHIQIADWTRADAENYTEQLKSVGFTKIDSAVATDSLYVFTATNSEGYRAGITQTADTYSISMSEVPTP